MERGGGPVSGTKTATAEYTGANDRKVGRKKKRKGRRKKRIILSVKRGKGSTRSLSRRI